MVPGTVYGWRGVEGVATLADYRWYVAQALPGLEALATHYLSREGISAFSPVLTGDGRKVRLYPGYLFVELAQPDEAGVVNRTRGVHKVLPIHTASPLALPRGFVEKLREKIAAGDFNERHAQEIVYRYVPQEEVMITMGPFRDHRGRFLRYRKGCAIILASLLGREVELPIRPTDLVPVPVSRARGASECVAA